MNNSRDKTFLFVIVIICLLAIVFQLLYFFCGELIHDILNIMFCLSLDDWKSIATIAYGAIGLSLGFWYFNKKIKIEDKNLKNDRARKRLTYLYDELNRTDKLTDMILSFDVECNENLFKIRAQLERMFLSIDLYIDNNDLLIGFTEDELKNIVAIHSFIINSDIISNISFDELNKSERSKEYIKYIEIFQEARTTCLQKIESF